VVKIDAGGDDESGGEDGVNEKKFWRVKEPEADPQGGGERLDDGIAGIEMGAATAGAAPQRQVAEDGKVQEKGNFDAAGATAGGGMNDGSSQRPTEDADIQKRADAGADEKHRDELEPGIHVGRPAAWARAVRISTSGAGRPVQMERARAPWCRSMPKPSKAGR